MGIHYTGNADDLRASPDHPANVLETVKWRYGTAQGEAKVLTPAARQVNDAVAFSDADWAGDTDTRRSMCSSLVKMAGGPVAWRVSKSTLVGLSTAETETDAAMQTAKLSIFVVDVARQLRCPPRQWIAAFHPPRMRVYVDNQAAIAILRSQARGRNRHMDIRLAFLRQHLEINTFEFIYVASEDNESDVGTKQLDRDTMQRLTMYAQGYRRPHSITFAQLMGRASDTKPQAAKAAAAASVNATHVTETSSFDVAQAYMHTEPNPDAQLHMRNPFDNPPLTPTAPASSPCNNRTAVDEAGPSDTGGDGDDIDGIAVQQ